MKEGKLELTKEEQDLILRGERPEDMPYNIFRQVRKEMQRRIRVYIKGRPIHYSIQMVKTEMKEGYDPIENIVGVTYKRKEQRRHKKLGRK